MRSREGQFSDARPIQRSKAEKEKLLRELKDTCEVIYIKKGKLRVDFYDNTKTYLESHVLNGGDVILLSRGGHGFEVIEDVEMIEVKQGPYKQELDKDKFQGINGAEARVQS